MLLAGTILVQRRPSLDVRWRLGIQLLAWRAWFWARLADGTWEKTSYRRGPRARGEGGGHDGGGDAPGGVREPRRPLPPSGAAAISLPLPPKKPSGDV